VPLSIKRKSERVTLKVHFGTASLVELSTAGCQIASPWKFPIRPQTSDIGALRVMVRVTELVMNVIAFPSIGHVALGHFR
jgi:hypothetical protein